LAEEIEALAVEGLITVEPIRVWERDGNGDEVRATVWGPRTGPGSPHLGAVAAFHRHGADAATVLLGVDGVLEGERRRARFVAGNRGVPAITVAVGARGAIDAALAEVDGAAPFVTVEGVETYSGIDRSKLHSAPAIRATLVTSEVATSGAHPRYLELVRSLRREGAAGATALRGVWGYRGGGEPHGDRVLALRRDVPVIVEAIDAPDRSARWLEIAAEIAGDDDVVHSDLVRARSP
jgi:PII-like signaling protein